MDSIQDPKGVFVYFDDFYFGSISFALDRLYKIISKPSVIEEHMRFRLPENYVNKPVRTVQVEGEVMIPIMFTDSTNLLSDSSVHSFNCVEVRDYVPTNASQEFVKGVAYNNVVQEESFTFLKEVTHVNNHYGPMGIQMVVSDLLDNFDHGLLPEELLEEARLPRLIQIASPKSSPPHYSVKIQPKRGVPNCRKYQMLIAKWLSEGDCVKANILHLIMSTNPYATEAWLKERGFKLDTSPASYHSSLLVDIWYTPNVYSELDCDYKPCMRPCLVCSKPADASFCDCNLCLECTFVSMRYQRTLDSLKKCAVCGRKMNVTHIVERLVMHIMTGEMYFLTDDEHDWVDPETLHRMADDCTNQLYQRFSDSSLSINNVYAHNCGGQLMLNNLGRWICNKCSADICLTCTEDNNGEEHTCCFTCVRCTTCFAPIYKDGGCNHVTCSCKAELLYNRIALNKRWVIGATNIGPNVINRDSLLGDCLLAMLQLSSSNRKNGIARATADIHM